jgi:predicted transcriptional regulator
MRTPKDVTDAELAVLQVLWKRGPAAIRDITDVLYPRDVETQYSTVKRLLARLEAKGFVRRDRRESVV